MKNTILCLVFALLFLSCKEPTQKQITISGSVFGTSYSVVYEGNEDYEQQFDSLFYILNKSMSTYQVNSVISKINRNEEVEVDAHFRKVFLKSKDIFRETNGAFDPTVGAFVNAWNFGPEGRIEQLDSTKIASLLPSVGFNNIVLSNGNVSKLNTDTYLDFNAIAKGYGVDVLALFLEDKGVNNYLVEIGGEIRCKGNNVAKGAPWKIGIDDPNFNGEQSYSKVVSLYNVAMATSGVYRKYKVDEEGNRYAHIINAKTGYPSKTNVLSVSVIANDCMTADAFATAFQAMGIEKVTEFLKKRPELKVYFIFENKNKELETLALNGFPIG
jgi:thiamine biosynthesis lipoprotein